MNIHEGIEELMKYVSTSNGVCLNIEERYKLEIALNNLHIDTMSEEMWFWGKIIGVEKDYYVALGINFREHPQFPKKKFYFCNSANFVFSELPEVLEHHLKDMEKFNTYFIGNPDVILEKYESHDDRNEFLEESDDNEDIFKPQFKLKNLTEGDRLSYVVRSIDFDTNVIPEGAFKMLPINEIRRNDTFTGLNSEDLSKFCKFLHFRLPRNSDKMDLIKMGKCIFNFNFLDSIDQDQIKGSWSIQLDSTKTISNVRSLLWPGYFAFHKANSKKHGGVYFGFGIKNIDMAFMQ